jgi:hypothetical protein
MIADAGPLAQITGVGAPIVFYILGVGLIIFAGGIILNVLRPQLNIKETWAIIIGDISWVAASIALLLLFPSLLSSTGHALVIGIAAIVAGFAVAQFIGLRRAQASAFAA